jgi:endoglycosylceramidase
MSTLMRALAWIVVIAGCGDAPAPQSYHVRAGFLRDPDGRAVIMRGVNLAGAHKYPPYLDDKQPADYERVRTDWSMNGLRFLMTWSAVEPEPGRYDDAYLDAVAERLAWANAAGLLVVLDMHQDIYGEGFGFDGAPRWTCDEAHYAAFTLESPWFLNSVDPEVQACFDELYTLPERRSAIAAAWRHVAERLGDAPAVIGFDPMNEPSWGSYPIFQFERDRLQPFYEEIVRGVREAAPNWVAFLEPSAGRNGGVATSLQPFPFPNVMYAPHSYDVSAESGAGFDPAKRQLIIDNLADLAYEAGTLDAGLWIGEYGGVAADPGIVEYMTAQYDAAGLVAAGTMYWAYDKGDGYALLDADGNEKPLLVDTLVRPYPERVAGTPLSYAFDAATSSFTLRYAPDRSIAAPTVIAVPPRRYPTGYQVECGGCEYERMPATLLVTKPPQQADVTITLRPQS